MTTRNERRKRAKHNFKAFAKAAKSYEVKETVINNLDSKRPERSLIRSNMNGFDNRSTRVRAYTIAQLEAVKTAKATIKLNKGK